MSVNVNWNNTNRSIPQSGERGWAALTGFLVDLATNAQTTNKQLIGSRVATTTPVTVSAATDCRIGVNVASASVVNLPAGVSGQTFYIVDDSNAASTNNITIIPNGANTIAGTTSYVLNINKQAIGITFSGGDWKVFSNNLSTSFTPTSSDTLTNKKLVDSSCTFVDNGDNTKQLAFEVSGVATSTTRTVTIPNANVDLGNLTNSNISSSAAIAVTKLANGTSNQIIGANSGATANEFKTLAVGTSGTDFAIAHAANSITLNLPDASTTNRGAVTTGAQSFTGLKKAESGLAAVGTVAANDSNVTFTNTSNRTQICTPTAARTYTLPTTSILAGEVWTFYNQATSWANTITLNASGGSAVCIVPPQGYAVLHVGTATPTTPSHWIVFDRQSNPVSYTPTFGAGWGTVSGISVMACIKDVNWLQVDGTGTLGSTAASLVSFSLPGGLTLTSTRLFVNNTTSNPGQYIGTIRNPAGTQYHIVTATGTSTTLVYGTTADTAASNLTPANGNPNYSGSVAHFFTFTVPIS